MKLIKRTLPLHELDSIKCGEKIFDESGKSGIVEDIEVLRFRGEVQYYYRLKKNGTILIIV
nr:hypothetical protein [Pedobacter sp. ASV2]